MNQPNRTPWSFAVALALTLAPASGAFSAQLVTFSRGQSLVVQASEKRGAWYYFTLDGGGQMGVPVNRVVRIEEYEAPPPGPAGYEAPAVTQAPSGAPPAQSAPSETPARTAASADGMAPPAGNVMNQGNDDWRYKVKMSGGPERNLQQGGAHKPEGMGRPMGAGGRLPGGVNNNRRPPYQPPPQPPQNPPQQ